MNTLSHMHPTSFHPAARYHTGSASKPKSVCTLSSATSGPTEADGAVSGVLDAPPSPPPPSPPAVCPAEFNTTTNGECATAVPINSKKLVTPTPEACCAACAAVPVNVIYIYIYFKKIIFITTSRSCIKLHLRGHCWGLPNEGHLSTSCARSFCSNWC